MAFGFSIQLKKEKKKDIKGNLDSSIFHLQY